MKYNLQTTHLSLSNVDSELLDKKMDRLEKYLHPPFTADVRLIHDTHHTKGAVVTCIINIEQGKKVFHTERVDESIQIAVDQGLEAITQELKKSHDKAKKIHKA